MSRYTLSFVSPYTPQQVNDCFASYLINEGFEPKIDKGENIWKKGVGLLTAPQYVKLTYHNNVYIIEAWLKFALLPGVYFGEMGLDGFVGCIPKSMLRSRVDYILMMLQAQTITIQQMQDNPNIPQQMQFNYNANPNVSSQLQSKPYGNTYNIKQQIQNTNNQPYTPYNQGR